MRRKIEKQSVADFFLSSFLIFFSAEKSEEKEMTKTFAADDHSFQWQTKHLYTPKPLSLSKTLTYIGIQYMSYLREKWSKKTETKYKTLIDFTIHIQFIEVALSARTTIWT